MNKAKYYCDNINCNHNNTNGLCCLFNSENCKYRQLQKENAELKKQVSFLEDNLRVARKDRENLQLDVAKGLKEFVKDYPATSLRFLANEKHIEQLTNAKEIIREFVKWANWQGNSKCPSFKSIQDKAEQFLNSEVEK